MDESQSRRLTCRLNFASGTFQGYHQVKLAHLRNMDFGEHFRITGGALKNWFVAQFLDSLAVGLLWLIGL